MLLVLYLEYRGKVLSYNLPPMDYPVWLRCMSIEAAYTGRKLSEMYRGKPCF